MLSYADKDLMETFQCRAVNRVLKKDLWGEHTVPQGVAVFKVHHNGRIEYMFTKDDKIDMKRDDINDLRELVRKYIIDKTYIGLVFVMHSEAVKIVSKHMAHPF